MISLLRSFNMFIKQISRDSMLIVVCIAPILAALFFKFGIPIVEELLCEYLNVDSILADYYLLFDLMLSILTPYMFCFASSMVIITEYDENMTSYMAVTSIGKKGYLISRLVIPAVLSFFVSIILMLNFSLTKWSLSMILLTCLLTCILSICISLLLVSLSHNRVEGMAIAKLSGLVMVGLFIPFFLFSDVQYLFFFLPSFWIAKFCEEQNILHMIWALVTIFIWMWVLYKKFERKIGT